MPCTPGTVLYVETRGHRKRLRERDLSVVGLVVLLAQAGIAALVGGLSWRLSRDWRVSIATLILLAFCWGNLFAMPVMSRR